MRQGIFQEFKVLFLLQTCFRESSRWCSRKEFWISARRSCCHEATLDNSHIYEEEGQQVRVAYNGKCEVLPREANPSPNLEALKLKISGKQSQEKGFTDRVLYTAHIGQAFD